MPAKKTASSNNSTDCRPTGEAKSAQTDRRASRSGRPRWSSVYDDQRRAIEAARKEGIEEIALVIERHDRQVTRFGMNTEMLAEMLAHIADGSSRDDSSRRLRPSDRLAKAMREDEGDLPIFRTKEELFDALEAAD